MGQESEILFVQVEDVLHQMWAEKSEAGKFKVKAHPKPEKKEGPVALVEMCDVETQTRYDDIGVKQVPLVEPMKAFELFYGSMIGLMQDKLPFLELEEIEDIIWEKWDEMDPGDKDVFFKRQRLIMSKMKQAEDDEEEVDMGAVSMEEVASVRNEADI